VEGRYPYLLAVRDLGSGQQLLWLPAAAATTAATVAALASLVALYGAPVVLKSDNGAAFVAEALHGWLRAAGVEPLFSPPGLPSYNGSCEAGIGSLQWRTEWRALRRGHPWEWTWDDVEGARLEANAQARPQGLSGPTPDESWSLRPVLLEAERAAFQRTVARYREEGRREQGGPEGEGVDALEQRAVDRVAIRRALVAHGYLLFTRRRIPLPIRPRKVADIP
jgi:putative transposase